MKMSSENIFSLLGATLNSWIFAKIDFRRTSGLNHTIQQQSRGDLCSINTPQFLPSAFLTNGSFSIQITFLFLETTNERKKNSVLFFLKSISFSSSFSCDQQAWNYLYIYICLLLYKSPFTNGISIYIAELSLIPQSKC